MLMAQEPAWLSAIIGGALTLSGSYLAHRWKETTKNRATTAAIMAEIDSILHLIEARGYVPAIELEIRKIIAGSGSRFYIPVRRSYFHAYEGNAPHIGVLGLYAPKCVRFYHAVFSTLENLKTVEDLPPLPMRVMMTGLEKEEKQRILTLQMIRDDILEIQRSGMRILALYRANGGMA
jgi:hypothetical protein